MKRKLELIKGLVVVVAVGIMTVVPIVNAFAQAGQDPQIYCSVTCPGDHVVLAWACDPCDDPTKNPCCSVNFKNKDGNSETDGYCCVAPTETPCSGCTFGASHVD